MACCHYHLGSYVKSCQLILDIVACLPTAKDQHCLPAASNHVNKASGRQLQLVSCTQSDILAYSISVMISCLRDKASKASLMDDMLVGHMIVLIQFCWPKYESLFCELVHSITKRGKFIYNLFCTYVINIDMLEEFAYIWTQGVTLDILPTSAKGTAQARAVTRGVNKVVKEDVKLALERQVFRSHESVYVLLRQFLLEEAELLKQNLMT
jgi:integrator complex subunit 10